MASPQGFGQGAHGCGSDQIGVQAGTLVGRAWMVNGEVSEGATSEVTLSSHLITFWIRVRVTFLGGVGELAESGRAWEGAVGRGAGALPRDASGLCTPCSDLHPQACSKASVPPGAPWTIPGGKGWQLTASGAGPRRTHRTRGRGSWGLSFSRTSEGECPIPAGSAVESERLRRLACGRAPF